jgi:ribosomal protein L19
MHKRGVYADFKPGDIVRYRVVMEQMDIFNGITTDVMKYNGIIIEETNKIPKSAPGLPGFSKKNWSYYKVYCIYTGRIIDISFSDIEKI